MFKLGKKFKEKNFWLSGGGLLLVLFLVILAANLTGQPTIKHQRAEFIALKQNLVGALLPAGDYACCLQRPCTYCLEKTPGHGVGATCHCLTDIVLGQHPCGECIGEILEGHGNPYLAKYFARAIAQEVGEQHLPALRQIIAEKYGKLPAEQL